MPFTGLSVLKRSNPKGIDVRTIEAVVLNGRVRTARPLDVSDNTRCVVTVLDKDLRSLRDDASARLSSQKQRRLHRLLGENKCRSLRVAEERELDRLLVEVHELMARRAEAGLAFDRLKKKR